MSRKTRTRVSNEGRATDAAGTRDDDEPSIRGQSQPLPGWLLLCDALRLDRRMTLPLDEGDIMPRSGFEQGEGQTLSGAIGDEAVISLFGGTDDVTIEDGGIQGRESERDERMQGWVD